MSNANQLHPLLAIVEFPQLHGMMRDDLSTLTAAELRDSADEALDYPDGPGYIACADDVGVLLSGDRVAVYDVPYFVSMWGYPVTHERAAEIVKALREKRIESRHPIVTADDCRWDLRRAEDRAQITEEHGSECDCHDCRGTRPLCCVRDIKFVGGVTMTKADDMRHSIRVYCMAAPALIAAAREVLR